MVSSKVKLISGRVAENQRIVKNAGTRGFKFYSDTERIKVRGNEAVGSDVMKTGRKLLAMTRKSLSPTEGDNQTDLNNPKGTADCSKTSMPKSGSSVKIKVRRKVLADVSNVKSYILRSRATDGSKPLKSLSPTEGVDQTDLYHQKGTADSSKKSKLKSGSSVKINGRKVLADVTTVRNYIRRSRASDGSKPLKSLSPTEGVDQTDLNHQKDTADSSKKSKPKSGSSVKIKDGRKVLADVSTVRNYIVRSRASDGSKPQNDKSGGSFSIQHKIQGGKALYGSRVSVGQSTDFATAISRKPVMGKGTANRSVETHLRKNSGIRDSKIYSDKLKALKQEIGTDGRKSARKPLTLTRKSLPVTRMMNKTHSTHDKGENSKKGTRTCNFSVTTMVGGKVVPNVRGAKNHLLRSRVSDGFVSMVPVGRSTLRTSALSRKPIKTANRTTHTSSNSQKTSTFNYKSNYSSSSAVANITKDKEEEVIKASAPENAAGVTSRSRASRRRSFTSLLVGARSKVLGELAEGVKQEELPSIDDNTNDLEVAEYVDEIYQYYWLMETENPSLENYMMIQKEITPALRGILINWLIEVHLKFELMQETLFLMVALLDRFLSKVIIEKKELQLVGLTALLLASKYEDFWHPKVKDLISITADSYTRDQMLGMEKLILKKLMFRLNAPTLYVFMLRFLKAAKSDTKLEHLAFYLIELSLVEYEALKFKPSLLCASAIYLARFTLQISPAWTKLLRKHTHYEESDLRDCADMILGFQKTSGRGPLRVTHDKYMQNDRSCVAAIKAMDRLPLMM
ncbi:cyclin-A1-1 [Telopea speciosissima]|uniref:cyclin-A1-1 n=1 Tax=Telopea speciosissima TaxID=54955 RepID=UPI001CC777D9|nr:cyclin-A1-1 [Telopea speciosissima]